MNDYLPSPAPRYATRRNPANPTFGARVGAIAKYLGGALMPWQQYVADVGCELDPVNPGAWRYQTVVVSVPRQAGKTFLLRCIQADRLLCYPRHEIMMTAQTGRDARKRWAQLTSALRADEFPETFAVRLAQGTERLENLENHSYISPFAPTPKSIHGDSLHFVSIDEAWAFDTAGGYALENAINPTQLTVLDSQIWIVSTRGTAASSYLNGLIEKGRAAVDDPDARIAFFEWSADEKLAEQNPYSDATLAFHPAIGHTQTAEKIRVLNENASLASWRRSILNLETQESASVIDLAIWESLADPRLVESVTPIPAIAHIAIDCAYDGSAATVAAAWRDPEAEQGRVYTQVIKRAAKTNWVRETIAAAARAGYASITVDPSGTLRSIMADLVASDDYVRDAVHQLRIREYATSCQYFLDAIREGTICHAGQPANDVVAEAIGRAAIRPFSGVVGFDTRKSTGPIDALRATAIAVTAAATQDNNSGVGIV